MVEGALYFILKRYETAPNAGERTIMSGALAFAAGLAAATASGAQHPYPELPDWLAGCWQSEG
ncbi:hypothetical protein V474_08310 [Novosphingobium barchaimii LL02]|uniref:Uncharacterized protein n=1 Tax=Novosphingobium barchaimii LL02 TaxID=1114963 RepID=A0A0J7Y7X4_9SPHN|nr:hypothetical protein V474_08310 [Novosphingobium barchaimii LL02]